MATEVDFTYLGRHVINQYVFKLDVRLQRLYCSADTAIAAPATPTECPATDLRTEKTPVDTWIKVTDYLPMQNIFLTPIYILVST